MHALKAAPPPCAKLGRGSTTIRKQYGAVSRLQRTMQPARLHTIERAVRPRVEARLQIEGEILYHVDANYQRAARVKMM